MDQMTCTPPFPFEFLIYSVGTCDTGGSNIAWRDYEICVKLKKMCNFRRGQKGIEPERYWFDHIIPDVMLLGTDAHRQKYFCN